MSVREMIAAAAAALVAAYVVWRWRKLSLERRALGVVLVVALGVYASGVLSTLPDPKTAIEDVSKALGAWTYAVVALAAFLETGAFVGLVAPGETIVMAAGVVAGQGAIELLPLIGIVWFSAVLGDTTSFFIGKRLGRGFLERHGPRFKITEERLHQVEGYFDRHGGKTILIGRFIGLVRALAPFIAGSSRLPYGRFIPYSVVGTGLWATLFCTIGYLFWRSFDRVAHIVGQAIFGFGLTVAVIVGVIVAYRRRHEISDWFVAHERHPLVRPLLWVGRPVHRRVVRPVTHVAMPYLRFLFDRVSPGTLGLDLTTLLAIAGVGIFVFVTYLNQVVHDPGPTPFDTQLLDLADRLRNDMLVDVAKVVTALGAFPTVATLVVATAVLLVVRKRYVDAGVLVLGFVLVYMAVKITKADVARPRPTGPLVDASGEAYPSGHAAYATAWVAAAVALTRRLRLVASGTLVLVALVIAAAVGVTRVYLRAHWPSDVAGGWGLGIGIFATLAAVALVVEYIRHNGGERAAESPESADAHGTR